MAHFATVRPVRTDNSELFALGPPVDGGLGRGHRETEVAGVPAGTVAGVPEFVDKRTSGRSHVLETIELRGEADLVADLAQILLGANELRSALDTAAQRLAKALDLPCAAIELDEVAGDERRAAIPLRDGTAVLGTLVVPGDLPGHTLDRLQQRIVPSLASLLRAACDRETITNSLQASRQDATSLTDQQAALRRVAMLVARGAPPAKIFLAVTEELGRLLGWHPATLLRYEPDGTATKVAGPGALRSVQSFPLSGENVATEVFRTGRPARIDNHEHAVGRIAEMLRSVGIRSAVGVPVMVDGRLWGVAAVGSPQPLPADTEVRMAEFTELVATAIANVESHAQLTASRARIVAAADSARRRIERDLHDGAQQRLVALGLQLRLIEAEVPADLGPIRQQLSEVTNSLTCVLEDLRELSRGIHPAILAKGGLGPAVKTLARRSPTPVDLKLAIDRPLPERVEVGAYYVVSEALCNIAKHAEATVVRVDIESGDDSLRLAICDNGIGGADTGKGSGLIGLQDRVETLGGHLDIVSPAGHGTALLAEIPTDDD